MLSFSAIAIQRIRFLLAAELIKAEGDEEADRHCGIDADDVSEQGDLEAVEDIEEVDRVVTVHIHTEMRAVEYEV